MDESAESVIGTFATVASWQRRVTRSQTPSAGSELADDDQDWPYNSVSMVAWNGLVAASDHLNAVRGHVQPGGDAKGQLFALAHLTMCRSALIGGAQAMWVLGPDSPKERVRRSRIVTAELYKKHLQYLRGTQEALTGLNIGNDTVAAHVHLRRNQLLAKQNADGETEILNTTDMIRQAAECAFRKKRLVQQVVLAWQSTSGAAHGSVWPVFGTPGTTMSKLADEGGMAEMQAGGSLVRMANPYMVAFYFAEQAWQLFDQRGRLVDGGT
jgi:hypothetical protein